ncbi:SDR family NAD(P)-dependent oxidoreductase [Croceicoccus bisphenolivorans]|uniref:SDR family NAD(P)-dependent oxidoreductase n=1 Tax=Croceicoccus bisphenolivorans TaxID=1783232 RepID=UPI000836B2C2|nr:SDR family oxidoreductase [Croceicoccus bisphenolivorans]
MIDAKRISNGPVQDRLKDKVCLITGAGGGQGRVVALLFAQAGARVYASDVNAKTLAATQELADDMGLSITTTVVDASSQEQTLAWADEAVTREGRIDVLYNNGAHVHMAPFSEMTAEQWHETIRLELDVIFMPTKAVWPIMTRQQNGSIINIASCQGVLASEGLGGSAHSAGKGGVIAVTRQLALEGAPHWIRVNCISPGPIMGPTLQQAYDGSEHFRALFDSTPMLERHGFPPDVAYLGIYLASDESQFITGVNIPVDGGAVQKVGTFLSRANAN